mgnify:CR=1 FL=1
MEIDRTKFIGASEVPAILGLDQFMTPLKLWSVKTGKIEADDLSENEAVEWGTRLERLVSDKFAEKHNVKLMAYKRRYVHPRIPYFSCELDNIIVGTEELVEIKTVNANAWKHWANPDELPAKVIAQVMAQMGLSGRRRAWVACLCGGQKYIEKLVSFDKEFFETIENKVVDFWEHFVLADVAPMATAEDDETLLSLFPENKTAEITQTLEEFNTVIARHQELNGQIKSMETEKSDIENKIKQVIGDGTGFKTSEYVTTWKAQASKRVDNEAVKRDNLYEKYLKESSTRVLRITKNKGD